MDRKALENHIANTYGCFADYPGPGIHTMRFIGTPGHHKWFAVVMDICKTKLGCADDATIDILNVKCPPLMIGSLLADKGFYPAYHMNKANWITICLDGTVESDKIIYLLDISYQATGKKAALS